VQAPAYGAGRHGRRGWRSRRRAHKSYPAKPIKLVCPIAPGGATDFIGRRSHNISARRSVAGGRREPTGSGGIPGTDYVVRSAPDGYTLVMMASRDVHQSDAAAERAVDAFKDLQVVSRVNSSPLVLVVSPTLPVKTYPSSSRTQGQSRQAQLCLRRHRHLAAFGRRDGSAARRRRCRACALSGHRPVVTA